MFSPPQNRVFFTMLIPHVFVWGSCFCLCAAVRSSSRPLLPPCPSTYSQLTHTQLFHTHNSPTHDTLTHNSPTQSHTQLSHTLSHTHYSPTHNTWHLWHWAWFPLAPWSPQLFVWQAWHSDASTSILCGRRGIREHQPPFCAAGVALGDIDLQFVWQAWHLRHWAGSGGALGRGCDAASDLLCVAGVALGDMNLHFVWQASPSLKTLFHLHPTSLSRKNLSRTTLSHTALAHVPFHFPALPIPSSPFFCYLLEKVDMWGHPVL